MRVFCPEHKRGFFSPRQSPIKCENRGHVLGELDFEGEGRRPAEIRWQYCCNCEHFCPVDFDQYGLDRCPVCTRRSSLLYLCDRCHVISFESNTPLQTKNFTLNADGVPEPSCPGCLRSAAADLHEHFCDLLNTTFITALDTCPVCEERLDVAPAFPSTVALYLKRTRAANKVNVTFDYETESFVPVEDGEFVVVTSSEPAIVLPRAPRFGNRRDFYEYYQDYYHCPKPDAGEVQIVQPATVVSTASGWGLETMGVLEVLLDQPKPKAVPVPVPPPVVPKVAPPAPKAAPLVREEVIVPKQPEPAPTPLAVKDENTETPCSECGALVESRYAFCWKCGNALTPNSKSSRGGNPSRGTLLSSAMGIDDDELTVQHEMRPASSSMFPWTTTKQSEHPSSSRGSVLKLIGIGGVAFLLLSLGLFGLTRSADSQAGSETATATAPAPQQTVAETTPEPVNNAPVTVPAQLVNETKPEVSPSVSPEDELLARLRERRITATNSERPKIVEAFAKIERKYPRDYRFPYERAKLVVKGQQSGARNEAFKALSIAAERAIAAGKANEMLSGLETDKAGDFHRLAQGRQEWTRLVVALRRKDTSLLANKTQFQ
ncbi:MAG TPA: hypothetical protein VFY61_12280 [Pyrinomonadaceae bacterium]|nr:hypothetical protein [Pyrinomonadaceae bacterium]